MKRLISLVLAAGLLATLGGCVYPAYYQRPGVVYDGDRGRSAGAYADDGYADDDYYEPAYAPGYYSPGYAYNPWYYGYGAPWIGFGFYGSYRYGGHGWHGGRGGNWHGGGNSHGGTGGMHHGH